MLVALFSLCFLIVPNYHICISYIQFRKPVFKQRIKRSAPPGTMDAIKRGAFLMPKSKLTIVPVTLHSENENSSTINPAILSTNPICTIKTATAEIPSSTV